MTTQQTVDGVSVVIDPHDITHLLYSAKRNGRSAAAPQRRSVAAELQAQLASDRESVDRLVAMFEHGNLRPKQAEMRRRGLQRLQESVARHEALLASYASLRVPGALFPVRKSTLPCEPEVTRWARRLQDEVEQRAWESLRMGEVG